MLTLNTKKLREARNKMGGDATQGRHNSYVWIGGQRVLVDENSQIVLVSEYDKPDKGAPVDIRTLVKDRWYSGRTAIYSPDGRFKSYSGSIPSGPQAIETILATLGVGIEEGQRIVVRAGETREKDARVVEPKAKKPSRKEIFEGAEL